MDIYLGSQTQEVRDLVREEVPEATIWEPQMDWLNLPSEYEKVGRLVMADREAIMLATFGEETGGVHHTEKALTGSGTDGSLVMLIREMLGFRLDHLDAQSETSLNKSPLTYEPEQTIPDGPTVHTGRRRTPEQSSLLYGGSGREPLPVGPHATRRSDRPGCAHLFLSGDSETKQISSSIVVTM